MKRVLKIILITFLCFVGACGLLIGGMYVFGALDEKIVYAEDLSFTEDYAIMSSPRWFKITTSTADVTKTEIDLTASENDVVMFTKKVTIGSPFQVKPSDVAGVNRGGIITLTATYNSEENGVVIKPATCKVLIDIPVERVNFDLTSVVLEANQTYQFAEANVTKLADRFGIVPSNALLPYRDITKLEQTDEDSPFYYETFKDKRIFLTLRCENVVDNIDDYINFEVTRTNGEGQPEVITEPNIEVRYVLDNQNNFVFLDDIKIVPLRQDITKVFVDVYVCPTYEMQAENEEVLFEDFRDGTVSSTTNFLITEISVNKMSTTVRESGVYLGEDLKIYLNNNGADLQENEMDLGVVLNNNDLSLTIDDNFYRNNVYLQVVKGNCTIENLDGKSEKNSEYGINVNYTYSSSDPKNKWCWKLKFNSFEDYYQYFTTPTEENKIAIQVSYYDGKALVKQETITLAPKVREVDSISAKYVGENVYSSQEETYYTVASGENFDNLDGKFKLNYTNTPTFTELKYYLPYSDYQIATVPVQTTETATWRADFTITLGQPSGISSLTSVGNWATITYYTLKQGSTEFTRNVSTGSNSGQNSFLANEPISVSVYLTISNNNLPSIVDLFSYQTVKGDYTVSSFGTKFYASLGGNKYAPEPYLAIKNSLNGKGLVEYSVDYDFVEMEGAKYLNILTPKAVSSSYYKVKGIGKFEITARLVHTVGNDVYWLGKTAKVKVYCYEELSSLNIYNATTSNLNAMFGTNDISFKENAGVYYLFVTSNTKDALKNCFENDQLFCTATQRGFTLSATNPNANTITFGEWQEVTEDGEFVGYKVPYTIGLVESVSIDGTNILSNIFDVKVQANIGAERIVNGNFILTEATSSSVLPITIRDKKIVEASLMYGNSVRGEDNPIVLKAVVDSTGKVSWKVDSASSNEQDISILYALKYEDTNDGATTSYFADPIISMVSQQVDLDDGFVIDAPSYVKFVKNQEGAGGLTFNNMPYRADGILIKFKLFVSSSTDIWNPETMYHAWDGEKFVNKISSFLGETNAKELYFNVTGLNITITANKNASPVGYNGNSVLMFDGKEFTNNGLFNISVKNASNGQTVNVSDYSKFLTIKKSEMIGNQNLSAMTLSNNYQNASFTKDVLKNRQVQFTFYAGDNTVDSSKYTGKEIIPIIVGESVTQNSYLHTIQSAFTFEQAQNLLAPCTADLITATYKKSTFAGNIGDLVDILVEKYEDGDDSYTISGNTLQIKTLQTASSTIKVVVTVTHKETGEVLDLQAEGAYLTINVTSKYSANDIKPITLEKSGLANGVNLEFVENSGLATSNITNIEVLSFEDIEGFESVKNGFTIPVASSHMSNSEYNAGTLTIYTSDLNADKQVFANVKFIFADASTWQTQIAITVEKNIALTFTPPVAIAQNAEIVFNNNTFYTITRNGSEVSSISDSEWADYDETNFNYDETKFTKVTLGDNFLVLRVDFTEGSSDVLFDYVTESGYVVTFEIEIEVA